MRNALVISPYATFPLDVGRRRRVHQTTSLLAENGFRVTLLLLACEEGWRVRHQEADFEQLREQWGEVIVVYGDPKIGLPPRNGDRHRLDEWWDFNLEHLLRNLLSRRFFDICLVHQVWLSRAFDLVNGSTTKILDIHEILWRRKETSEAAGVAPEGFLPDEPSELFGIERADIILTAVESDAADLARRMAKKIVNLPLHDQGLEADASRMVEVSLSPSLSSDAQAAVLSARDNLRARSVAGATKLLDALARATEPMIIDLGGADPQADCLVLQSYLSYLRVLAGYRTIVLVLPPDLMPSIAPFLPLAAKPITPEALPSALQGIRGRATLVNVFGTVPGAERALDRPYRVVRDLRWGGGLSSGDLDEETLAQVPFFHSNIDREPAALELRRQWARDNAGALGDAAPPIRFVFVDDLAGAVDLAGAADKLRTRMVSLADEAAFRAAAMALLERAGDVEVAWLARRHRHHHRLVVQICALRDIPLWAMLDAACFSSGRLPQRIAKEFDRACEHQLRLLSRIDR